MSSYTFRLVHFASVCAIAWIATSIAVPSRAQEKLGELGVSDIFIEPNFTYTEPRQGRFEAGNSYLAGEWKQELGEIGASAFVFNIKAVVKVGSTTLLGRPVRYEVISPDRFGLVEAYGQAETTYGRFRFGLVPIPYGLEGGDVEPRLVFPRSLFYRRGYIGLRDQGIAYRISNEGFFSDWTVHNGESGPDLDSETWFTARWGWRGLRSLTLGLSGSVGRTAPSSTNPSGGADSAVAGLDVNQPAKIRIANGFAAWETRALDIRFEAHGGTTRQGELDTNFTSGHLDVDGEVWNRLVLMARYDALDPDLSQAGDRIEEISIGIGWRSRDENSFLSLIGSKLTQEGLVPDAHQVRLIWRMTPFATARLSPL